ncbi:MAG: hypothetical protein GY710_24315 [Desulfobacteraceae bacterium]|nr:hypothetical protein [Desulfobacteraceae bacterium]
MKKGTKKTMKTVVFWGFIILSVLFICILLFAKIISGTDFTILVTIFIILGLIRGYAQDIKEITGAGFTVKFKEIEHKAYKAIEELKASRIETFRFLLTLATKKSGGFFNVLDVLDERLNDFWFLHEKIVEFNLEQELSEKILEVTKVLMLGQLQCMAGLNPTIRTLFTSNDKLLTYAELKAITFIKDSTGEVSISNATGQNIDEKLYLGLNAYEKLFNLSSKLKDLLQK